MAYIDQYRGGQDYDPFGPNLEQNQYKGFVPLVGGNVPSRNYGFTPLVGGKSFLPSIESRSGSGSWGDLGDTGFVTPPEEQPQYDFSPSTGKSKEEEVKDDFSDLEPLQPQVPLPVKPPQAQAQVSPSDDPMSEDEDTLGTSQTSTISDQETITDFLENIDNTISETLGFDPPMQPAPDVVGLDVGKGLEGYTTPQGIVTGAAKGAALGFAQGALGINAPLGLIIGAISGISSTISHQEALQNVVDLEAQAWGIEKGREIGFFNALGSYFFGQNPLTIDEQEMDFFQGQAYGKEGPLHGFPVDPEHSTKTIVEVMQPFWDDEEAAHDAAEASGPDSEGHGPDDDIDPGTFGAFLGEGQTITEAIEAAEAEVAEADAEAQADVDAAEAAAAETAPAEESFGEGQDADPEGGGDEGAGDDPGDGGGACWVAGTQILMEDGSCKNIENLKIGDMVMSFPENSKIRRWNTSLEAKPIIDLLVSKADIWHLNDSMVSENEWMVKSDGTASLVQWLNVGDELMDQDGNKVKVYRNEPAEGKLSRQVVYNFESENNYSYIANNMRTLKGKAVRMSESKMNSFGEGYFSDESNNMKQGWSMQDEYKRNFGN